MHTFCEVGQLNWIGPLSVDNPGVAVRQWQSRPSSRCYFNGPLLHSAYTPFKVLFFVKNIGQWHAKSGPKAAHGNFAMRKKKSGSLKKKWERTGRNASHFAHTHTHSAKLVVRISALCCQMWQRIWINGVSLNSLAHTFFYRTHRPNKSIAVIISNKRKYWKVHIRKQQYLILPVNSKKRQLMRTKTAVFNSSEGSFQWWR